MPTSLRRTRNPRPARPSRRAVRVTVAVLLGAATVAGASGCTQGAAFDGNQERNIIRTPTPKVGPGQFTPAPSLGENPTPGGAPTPVNGF